MNPTSLQLVIMESFAKGFSIKQIAKSLGNSPNQTQDRLIRGCERVGISTQRESIKAWFLSHPVHSKTYDPYGDDQRNTLVTMDDPMFQ